MLLLFEDLKKFSGERKKFKVNLKASCHIRFPHAFTALLCVFLLLTLVCWGLCRKRMRKSDVATRLYFSIECHKYHLLKLFQNSEACNSWNQKQMQKWGHTFLSHQICWRESWKIFFQITKINLLWSIPILTLLSLIAPVFLEAPRHQSYQTFGFFKSSTLSSY